MNDSGPGTGIGVVIALIIAAPLMTLAATAYQMWGRGGDFSIRPTAVTAPVPAEPSAGKAPAGGAPVATAPAATAAASAAAQASRELPKPVPGRSAMDFSAYRPDWEAALQNADTKQGQQLAQAGKAAAGVQACVACHGAQGVAQSGGMFPSLAGLSAEYLAKQLTDYRDGARNQALMTAIAKGLSPEEIGHVAAYYASLPQPPLGTRPAESAAARQLAVHGDNARALPACANCHGADGRGEGALLPRLAGQPAGYFIGQMNAFRNGQRSNDDVGVMRAFARRLSPEEIDALAHYYAASAQGAPPAPGQVGASLEAASAGQ